MISAFSGERDGRAKPEWRWLGPESLTAIETLHHAALATLADPSLVRPESRDFFAGILDGGGRALGAFVEGELIAYGLLQLRLEPGDDPHEELGFAPSTPIAKLSGASVATAFRGRRLHRQLALRRLALGRELGAGVFYATAAPDNAASWVNLIRAGMQIVRLAPRYGGLLRYLLLADGSRPVAAAAAARCAPADHAQQQALLGQGLRGVDVEHGPDGLRLVFAPCSRKAVRP